MKASNQPAKLADRVIAPGDGAAEPGVSAKKLREPAKLATDGWSSGYVTIYMITRLNYLRGSSVAHFVGLRRFSVCVPQARLGHRLGLSLCPPASQAH
ncbi:MAG: hypothetical protein ACR2HX_05665 [Pyrinomonadaceae bacterium]